MDWKQALRNLAPTVATALGGPLAGAAVEALGNIFGKPGSSEEDIKRIIESGQLKPEHVAELRRLELQYQNDEKERGFKYAELAFKDRDSARQANVQGGTQKYLFWLSLLLLVVTLGAEVTVLFNGYPTDVPEVVVGRVLGLLDAVAMLVLTYWYGTSNGSALKTEMLSKAPKD